MLLAVPGAVRGMLLPMKNESPQKLGRFVFHGFLFGGGAGFIPPPFSHEKRLAPGLLSLLR